MSETWEPWRQDELNRAQEDALLAPLKEQIEELEADNARLKVLTAIAEGHPEAQQLALAVLKTQTGGFSRWCA